jgi:two-component system, LytTR family, response regulator
MYKAIIIDDEEMARALLNGMLKEYHSDIEVVELCKDLPSGVKAIRKQKPDVVFLDIEMPGHSGLELLDFFNEDEISFNIIFTTAYNQYAIRAFKLSAIDYLLKPIEIDDLEKAIELFKKNKNHKNLEVLKQNLKSGAPQKIAINNLSSVNFIDINDIIYFKADGAYTHVFLIKNVEFTVSKGLKIFEEILEGNEQFFRCHKSYLVNTNYISGYTKTEGGYLTLKENHQALVSIDKIDELFKKTGIFVK